MKRTQFLKVWSIAVGAMDAMTGLLLILLPETVLRLLHLPPPSPEALVFLSWIGVFVLAIGLSYSLALSYKRSRGEVVWIITAMVRALVAVFITVKILDDSLARPWALVGLTDGIVATVQIVILRAGWWRENHR